MPKLLIDDFTGRYECGEGELPQGDREFRVYVGSVINIKLPGGIILSPCKLRFEESAGSLSANEHYQKWKRNHGCERCDSLLKQICTKIIREQGWVRFFGFVCDFADFRSKVYGHKKEDLLIQIKKAHSANRKKFLESLEIAIQKINEKSAPLAIFKNNCETGNEVKKILPHTEIWKALYAEGNTGANEKSFTYFRLTVNGDSRRIFGRALADVKQEAIGLLNGGDRVLLEQIFVDKEGKERTYIIHIEKIRVVESYYLLMVNGERDEKSKYDYNKLIRKAQRLRNTGAIVAVYKVVGKNKNKMAVPLSDEEVRRDNRNFPPIILRENLCEAAKSAMQVRRSRGIRIYLLITLPYKEQIFTQQKSDDVYRLAWEKKKENIRLGLYALRQSKFIRVDITEEAKRLQLK